MKQIRFVFKGLRKHAYDERAKLSEVRRSKYSDGSTVCFLRAGLHIGYQCSVEWFVMSQLCTHVLC
jgi:Rieske Fe-S protein